MGQVELEWAKLKHLVQGIADATAAHEFEWYADDPPCLQLSSVAATFRHASEFSYSLLFDRRTRSPERLFPGKSPLDQEEWQLVPKVESGSVVWSIRSAPRLHGELSSDELAQKIVERLIRYHEDYMKKSVPG